jgi:acyl-coenzyme A synthetase/AMP-(fatty) acid ligase
MSITPIGVLYQLAETRRKNVAFIKDKEVWTYERLAAEVDHLARRLVERGLRKGDRVALHMANLPEFIVAYHACFRAGVIAAPLNIRFKTAELRPLLERLRPTLYIGQAALYNEVASIDSSILPANSRFVVDGPVNDPRVQPWTSLFADVNRIVKNAEVRLVDDNGRPVSPGVVGELVVRAPIKVPNKSRPSHTYFLMAPALVRWAQSGPASRLCRG